MYYIMIEITRDEEQSKWIDRTVLGGDREIFW